MCDSENLSSFERIEVSETNEVNESDILNILANSAVNTSVDLNDDLLKIKINNWYLCSLVISPCLHILDIAADVFLAYQYYHTEQGFFLPTFFFIIFPAVVINMFSIRMYMVDKDSVSLKMRGFRTLLLILQIAPVIRYIEALRYSLALKRNKNNPALYQKYAKLLLKEDSNLALLRIMECFLESAPQQVLQIAILLSQRYQPISIFPRVYLYWSLLTSVMSTAWTFAMYNRSIRFVQLSKLKMKWIGSLIQFFWIFFVTGSRILAISEVASVLPYETVIGLIIHWFVMTLWLSMFEKTWFCATPSTSKTDLSKVGEMMFAAVVGLVYVFSYLAVSDNPTRYKYLFYYSVIFIENLFAILIWNTQLDITLTDRWWIAILSVTPVVTFMIGILLMLIYYLYYHPSLGLCYQSELNSLKNCKVSNHILDTNVSGTKLTGPTQTN